MILIVIFKARSYNMLLTSRAELQPDRLKGLPGCREAHEDHDLAGQGDHPVLASESDDGVLLNRARGRQGRVYADTVLGGFCGDLVLVNGATRLIRVPQ